MAKNGGTFTGAIKRIGKTQNITDRFSSRALLLEDTSGKYPNVVKFEFHNDRTDLLDNFGVGQQVTVKFDVTGREWTGKDGAVKYFNTLKGWSIQDESSASAEPSQSAPPQEAEEDDLPF